MKPFLGIEMANEDADAKRKESKRRYYEKNKLLVIARAKAWKAQNKEKVAAGAKVYRESHKEEMKALIAAWAAKFPEKRNATAKRYYERNPEKCRERSRIYYRRFPEKAAASRNAYRATAGYKSVNQNNMAKRRARIGAHVGTLSVGLAEKLIKLQKGRCACCGGALSGDYHLDHIVPLALGGSHEDSNIQLLHGKCNLHKHAKHPVDFMQRMGFLL